MKNYLFHLKVVISPLLPLLYLGVGLWLGDKFLEKILNYLTHFLIIFLKILKIFIFSNNKSKVLKEIYNYFKRNIIYAIQKTPLPAFLSFSAGVVTSLEVIAFNKFFGIKSHLFEFVVLITFTLTLTAIIIIYKTKKIKNKKSINKNSKTYNLN